MVKALGQHILYRRRMRILDAARRLDATTAPEAIEAVQVARFNAIWSRCLAEVPFYRAWAREHELPPRIARTDQLLDFPTLTKRVIVERSDEIFRHGQLRHAVSTGGSTGVPARFPLDAAGSDNNWAALYLARGWWGIAPFDRQLLLWGHSHLFGTGWQRSIASARRRLADRLIGATRLNAYDMTPAAIARYAAVMSRLRPDFVIGYTSAVFRLARHLERAEDWTPSPAPKGVILTSETATPADIAVVGRVFAAPVILEYGLAEMGVVAYSRPGDDPRHLHLLWADHIAVNDHGAIRVTTISNRIFPLVNYDTGDHTRPADRPRRTVLSFAGIVGRTQDVVSIRTRAGESREARRSCSSTSSRPIPPCAASPSSSAGMPSSSMSRARWNWMPWPACSPARCAGSIRATTRRRPPSSRSTGRSCRPPASTC